MERRAVCGKRVLAASLKRIAVRLLPCGLKPDLRRQTWSIYCILFLSVQPVAGNNDMARFLLSAIAGLLVSASVANAQTYPARAITIVVPYPAGAITDLLARDIADRLSKKYGQSVVVDNKPGAGTTLPHLTTLPHHPGATVPNVGPTPKRGTRRARPGPRAAGPPT